MDTSIDTIAQTFLATVDAPPLALSVFRQEAPFQYESALATETSVLDAIIARLPALWEVMWPMLIARGIPQAIGLPVEAPHGAVWSAELIFVGNATMQAINRQHRQRDAATDVLSFTLLADAPQPAVWLQLPEVPLGSVLVSLDWAWEETVAEATMVLPFVLERVIHGLLHLMGVTHDTEATYNAVVSFQQQTLAQLEEISTVRR
jgi:rRNA maturation RNase YbeY